jgi:glycine cleavage system H protein
MGIEATYPSDLLYHPEHDWARVDGDVAALGVTWFAQDALGEIVFCDLPAIGTKVTAGERYAELESVKAVSDVIAPLSGEVLEVNELLAEEPAAINEHPYDDGWLVRVRLSELKEAQTLLTVEQYTELLA